MIPEAALTAPEADPVCGPYLPKHFRATPAGERMGRGVRLHLGDSFDAKTVLCGLNRPGNSVRAGQGPMYASIAASEAA
jgi:hypothetical protein